MGAGASIPYMANDSGAKAYVHSLDLRNKNRWS
jgi:hypothetical protein